MDINRIFSFIIITLVMMTILRNVAVKGAICNFSGLSTQRNSTIMAPSHIFKDPSFWQHFQTQVQQRSWKCNFSPEILFKQLKEDATLYSDDTIFLKRRQEAANFVQNDTQWINIILGACKEITDDYVGVYSKQLQKIHMLDALQDFVEHLNCFYIVATEMEFKGRRVKPLSQDSSQIHDIDKLDPIMLVGYSEKFEDNQTTSVWDACVDRHTTVNPHHQAHCLWKQHCCDIGICNYCEELRDKAISEMVCDKVSRRLQKNLHGIMSDDIWNVETVYFKGLPQEWLDKATDIMENMKDHHQEINIDVHH